MLNIVFPMPIRVNIECLDVSEFLQSNLCRTGIGKNSCFFPSLLYIYIYTTQNQNMLQMLQSDETMKTKIFQHFWVTH